MGTPLLPTRVEQGNDFSRLGCLVDTCKIRPFVSIAGEASIRQIRKRRLSTVLPGQNVFDFERNVNISLGQMAVLAPMIGPFPNEIDKPLIHATNPHSPLSIVAGPVSG